MQLSLQNPDTRTLPDGWADHFDSERQIWYYIDLHAEKPRVSFAHPCDLDRQHPSSAPARVKEHVNTARTLQRPAGPRKNSSASVNSIIRETQRARRATVAQQLYASGLTLSGGGPSGLRTSSATFRRPSVSNKSASDEVASSSTNSTTVSSTSPSPLSPHLDTHHPRNFFDCTRLAPGTRRKTVNGARPLTPTLVPLAADAGAQSDTMSLFTSAQAFYHPSVSVTVNSSPSPIPIPARDPFDVQIARPDKTPSQRPGITIPSNDASSTSLGSNTANRIRDRKPQNGTNEDDLFIIPNHAASHTPSAAVSPLNMTALQDAQSGASGPFRKPRSLPPLATPILQPKPIRPMQGISLNLQVQVAGIPETPTLGEASKSKRKSQLLNFGLGGGKGVWKGKQRLIEPPEDDSGATCAVDMLASNMDDSFVLVDTLDRN